MANKLTGGTLIFVRIFDKDAQKDVSLAEATGTLVQIGFFGATPVGQQASASNTHTVAAGSTTTVFTNTTFDGGTGSTAYTVGDIVLALKNLGLLKA